MTSSMPFDLVLNGEVNRRALLQALGTAGAATLFGGPSAWGDDPTCSSAKPSTMARAIVIGINEYDNKDRITPDQFLTRPVAEACQFANWLIKKAGVIPQEITLLTNPAPPAEFKESLRQVPWQRAETDNIIEALNRVYRNAGADGERFFFYYTGHGGMTSVDSDGLQTNTRGRLPENDLFLPCDYARNPRNGAFKLNSIIESFTFSNCIEQFYFFDACRTVAPIDEEQYVAYAPTRRISSPQRRQFVMYSTCPGQVAKENGFFSQQLLNVLDKGQGSCVNFDEESQKFLVRWDGLLDYLKGWFDAKKVPVGKDRGKDVYLVPVGLILPGNYCKPFPPLVQFDHGNGKKNLSITVKPANKQAGAMLFIKHGTQDVIPPGTQLPATGSYVVNLPPGQYRVLVFSGREMGEEPVTLAEDGSVTVRVGADTLSAVTDPPLNLPEFTAAMNGPNKVMLMGKPSIQMELCYVDGVPIKDVENRPSRGMGSFMVQGLKPGFYTIRAQHGDKSKEHVISIVPNVNPTVKLDSLFPEDESANWPGAERIRSRFEGNAEPLLYQGYGPGAYLALAATATRGDVAGAAVLSKNFGMSSFANGMTGIRLVLGVELDSATPSNDVLKEFTIRVSELDGREGEELRKEDCQILGIKTFHVTRRPGPIRLIIERKQGEDVSRLIIASYVFPGRICDMIVEQQAQGSFRISQFAPEVQPSTPLQPEFPLKLYLCERELHEGHFDHVRTLLDELARMTTSGAGDPLCRAIAVYQDSLTADTARLQETAEQFIRDYPQAADGYVARGMALERNQQFAAATQAYWTAIGQGFPLLSDFLDPLLNGLKQSDMQPGDEKPRRHFELLQSIFPKKVSGLCWTAWRSSK